MGQGWPQVARLPAGAKEQRVVRLSPRERAEVEHLLALVPAAERLAQRQWASRTGLAQVPPEAVLRRV